MKKLLLLLLLGSQIFAESFYTLDKVKHLNLYLDLQADFFNPAKKKQYKEELTAKLEEAGFVFGKTDAIILVVKVKTLAVEESQAISLQIGLGEDVITRREGNVETFAYTYLANKLIEGYDPYADTLEALNSMIDDFIDAYEDDKEE